MLKLKTKAKNNIKKKKKSLVVYTCRGRLCSSSLACATEKEKREDGERKIELNRDKKRDRETDRKIDG